MKVETKSSFKHAPKIRSKDEIHQILEKKVEDKKKADQAKISKAAEAKANISNARPGSRVDPDKSALGLNDPNSPATHEKLRSALKSGLIKFNPKERAALANILK
jgi:hypothetical protein